MKVRLAKKAGFCMGVRRAMEIALEASYHHPDPIYTHGPLIHNPQVLRVLEKKGITVLDPGGSERKGTVIVRAHGIPPQEFERLDRSGFTVIDATCPRVIKVQAIIRRWAASRSKGHRLDDRGIVPCESPDLALSADDLGSARLVP